MREFRTQRKIEFADSDMGGIVHFARYLVFMETAEHEFLNALGTSVHSEVDGKLIGWPRVKISCEYKSPARYGDTLDILVRVLKSGRTSMTWSIRFSVGDREVATGQVTSVRCELAPEMRAIPIPAAMLAQIEED